MRIRVPASTSNLGPGFDCLGLALDLFLVVDVVAESDAPGVFFRGVQPAADNAFVRALARGGGAPKRARIEVESTIPSGRGLGSSGAAIVAGLLTARLAHGQEPDRMQLLQQAVALEGHPDNVAAAVHGGLVASAVESEIVRVMPLALSPAWSFLVVVPDRDIETAQARALLPPQVARADAVSNVQHVAFLLGALAAGDGDRLRHGLVDRLHQDLRLGLVPGLADALAALAAEPGCAGAALSGSGPALLGFVHGEAAPTGQAAVALLARHGVSAHALRLRAASAATWTAGGHAT